MRALTLFLRENAGGDQASLRRAETLAGFLRASEGIRALSPVLTHGRWFQLARRSSNLNGLKSLAGHVKMQILIQRA